MMTVGVKVGRLTIIGEAERGPSPYHFRRVHVVCDCGVRKVVYCTSLYGKTKSCGCLGKELTSKRSTKHGYLAKKARPSEYTTYGHMMARCYNPKCPKYRIYGARGITVCERWREDRLSFLHDMGPRPSGCSLERIDNAKGYSPENCKWATPQEQADNRRTNRLLTFNGRTQNIRQWSNELGIKYWRIAYYLKRGWSVERVLSTSKDYYPTKGAQ